MQLTSKKAFIGLSVASVVCILALVVYVWAVAYLDRVRTETQEVVMRAAQEGQREGVSSSNRTMLKKYGKDIETVNSYFLREADVAPFTERIESLGSIVGVTLTLDTLEQVTLPGNVKGLTLHVKAVGSFEEGMRLLKLFENFPARFEFSTVSLVREVGGVKEADIPQWLFEANIVMYNFITG